MKEEQLKIIGMAAMAIVVILVAISLFGFNTVEAGERAVVHDRWGSEFSTEGEGMFFAFPFRNQVTTYDVKEQLTEASADAATFDLQRVTANIAVRYAPSEPELLQLHRTLGTSYAQKVIDPAVQEAVKACTAKFTYQGLVQNRTDAKYCMTTIIEGRLSLSNIRLINVDITNFEPPAELSQAITAKEVAKQEAIRQLNLLEARKAEAQQKVVAAQAEADSARIIGEQVALHGEAYLFLQWIEAWDGKAPTTLVMNGEGETPFLLTISPPEG